MMFLDKIKKKNLYILKTFFRKNFKKFNGLKNLDKKMIKYLNYNDGYFIEIGAHDGIYNSNTFYFEKYKNWKGVLIEPSFNYKLLVKNRSKKNKFFYYGCSEFNSKKETTLLNSDDYSICKDLVDRNFLIWHSKKQIQAQKKMIETKIKLRTLNSILIEAKSPKLIDFFSLDVEGMEINVLKGINFNYFNFKHLLVECSNKKKYEEISKFLIKKKYIYEDNLTEWDYLFQYKPNS